MGGEEVLLNTICPQRASCPQGFTSSWGRALVPTAGLPEQCMCRVQLTFAPVPPHSGHLPFPWVLTSVPAQPEEGPSAPLRLRHPPFYTPRRRSIGPASETQLPSPPGGFSCLHSFDKPSLNTPKHSPTPSSGSKTGPASPLCPPHALPLTEKGNEHKNKGNDEVVVNIF